MSLPTIDYIDWIEGRPEAVEYDLGSSDLRGDEVHDVSRVVPERLDGLTDPGPAVDLEGLVAETYGVDPGSVLATPGASLANAVAAATALDRAQEHPNGEGNENGASNESAPEAPDGFDPTGRVLVEKPGYEPLIDTPQLFGARVDRFRRLAEEDWRLDPDRVAAAAVEDTALVTVTNRHNPSGRLTDRRTLEAAAAAAREVGATLLVDEVYAPYVTSPVDGTDRESTGVAFGGVTAAGVEGAVVTGSLTKFHGLGELQVGWLIGEETFIERARQVAQHFPALAGPSRALGRRVLGNRETLETESRDLLGRNAALLEEFVARRDTLSGTVYDGATYALLEHESADGDAVAAEALDRGLLVVPGRFFETPERFRVSLGRDTDHVREALSVLGETLESF